MSPTIPDKEFYNGDMHLILNNTHPAQINSTPIMILNTVLLLIPATP